MEAINIKLPKSWFELTPKQYRQACAAFASAIAGGVELKLVLLFRWAKLRLVSREEDNRYIIRIQVGKKHLRRKFEFVELSDSEIYDITCTLNWMNDLPPIAFRPQYVCGRKARETVLDSLTFEQFIILDNTLQGYISTLDNKMLRNIGRMLYPHKSLTGLFRQFRPKPWQETAILFWIAGFKILLGKRYPTFFQPAAGQNRPDPEIIRKNIETMFRALTKGDITKDSRIRQAPVFAALAELEAIAIESEQLKNKAKK